VAVERLRLRPFSALAGVEARIARVPSESVTTSALGRTLGSIVLAVESSPPRSRRSRGGSKRLRVSIYLARLRVVMVKRDAGEAACGDKARAEITPKIANRAQVRVAPLADERLLPKIEARERAVTVAKKDFVRRNVCVRKELPPAAFDDKRWDAAPNVVK